MNLADEITRAQDVKMILDNPIYKDAWRLVHDGIISAMNQSAMADQVTHSRLVMALQIANKVQKSFETTLETGKLAKMQLEEKGNIFGLRG